MKNVKLDFENIWHPFTQMKEVAEFPNILVTRAKGLKIFDETGKFYYDCISSWWCNTLGHNNPRINVAIKRQLDDFGHVLFAGFTHKPAIELVQKLLKLTPVHLSKVFFSDNGSTAVEVALKMSYQYWQQTGNKRKTKFVSLDKGYHGDTLGAMSVSGSSVFNRTFEGLFIDVIKVPTPSKCNIECISYLEDTLKDNHQDICAFIIEPLLLGAGGMIVYPKEYLEKAADLCKKYDVHLILDEIATGFGRTGKMFAMDHTPSVRADFVCLSKGITSGYLPIALTMTTDEIYEAFYDDYDKHKTFYHGHTYTANALGCAAANAVLDIMAEDDVLEVIKPRIKQLSEGIERFKELAIVGDVRQIGMVAAFDLKNADRKLCLEIFRKGLERNLVIRPLGDVVYLFLPLITTEKELNYILITLFEILTFIS